MTAPRWNVPAAWQWTSIDEIAEIIGGGTPAAGEPNNFVNDGIPWITPADLARNRSTYVTGGSRSLSQEGYANSGARLLPKGAVLFSSRAPIGYCAIASNPICTNQGFKSLVLRENLLPEYVRHYLLASKEYAESEASGTTFLELSGARMRTLALPVAPIAEQKRIVAKIEELTARSRRAKKALDAVPPLLDQLRQSILAAAFRGDLTADWRAENPDVEPADKLLARIRAERRSRWEAANPKRKYVEPDAPDLSQPTPFLPLTWTVASVSEVSECLDRMRRPITKSDRVAGPYPYYGANGQVDSVGEYIFDEELVLVTEDETFYGRTKPIAYRVNGKCWVNNHAHVLRALAPLPTDYLWQSLMYYHVEPWLSGTTGRAKLTQGALSVLPIAVAPAREMEVIASKVSNLLATTDALAEMMVQMDEQQGPLSRTILAKAFRGELVPQDPTDEPASVLLDRIRAARTTDPPTKRPRKTKSPAPPEPKPIRVTTPPQLLLDPHTLQEQVVTALWPLGPLDKDTAIRKAAESLRTAGHVDFQRLRADGPLYTQILTAIQSAVKNGQLDRPTRGYVRACKPDALAYTPDDWRHALVASLGPEPIDREQAIRNAAQWAREQLGLEFSRLRADGHIAEGLRSAITSAIRRGEIIGHAKRISRPA